jgi:hypothetical protein
MRTTLLLLGCVLALHAAAPSTVPSAADVTRLLRPHPRLWMARGEEARVRQRIASDTRYAAAWARLVRSADEAIGRPPITRVMTGRRLLHVSRETIRRVMMFAMVHRVTGEARYLAPAKANLLAAAAFTDWNPSHFLDVAEMTLALGVGYDWLFDDLTADERATIRAAILQKGVEVSFEPGRAGWATAENNWNQVCHGGLIAGALAVAEDAPDPAARTIARAVEGLPHSMRHYAPDGAYPEGPSYWDYGTTYNVVLAAALESALGSDYGVLASPGFLETADYFLHVTGPSGEYFNYADAGTRHGLSPSPAQYFFAARRNDASLAFTENALLAPALETPAPPHEELDRFFPLVFLWAGALGDVPAPRATHYVGRGVNPVALFRTSWDREATFVGIKGGSPSVNHGHMDVGSFVIDVHGVRIASDLGMQDYNSLEQRGLSLWDREPGSDRWRIFRIGASSHNVLTIDGLPQVVAGSAAFTKTTARSAVLDLSPVYAGQLASAARGIALESGGNVRIQDEIAADVARVVRWAMLTRAEVQASDGTAMLTRDGRTVRLRVVSPDDVTVRAYSTDPPQDYDAENPGTRIVGFEVALGAGARRTLVVDVSAGETPAAAVRPLSAW